MVVAFGVVGTCSGLCDTVRVQLNCRETVTETRAFVAISRHRQRLSIARSVRTGGGGELPVRFDRLRLETSAGFNWSGACTGVSGTPGRQPTVRVDDVPSR